MKIFLFIFLLISVNTQAQVLAGYINTTPGGSYDGTCALVPTVAAYTNDGTIAIGKTLTNAAGGSLGLSDYNYYAYALTSGAAASYGLQVYVAGYINGTLACGGGGGGSFAKVPYDTTNLLVPKIIYNLNNGSYKGGYSDSTKKLFTGITNNGGLPINGAWPRVKRDRFAGSAATWFPGDRGLCYILDLIGDSNATKLTTKDTITQIVWKEENNFNPKDTLRFYVIDAQVASGSAASMAAINRPDSLLTPFATLAFSNRNQWDSTGTLSTAARFIMMRITGHDSTASYGVYTFAHPGAIKIKGNRTSVAVQPFVIPALTAGTTLDSMTGKNIASTIDDTLFQHDNVIRFYDILGAKNYSGTWLGGYDTMRVALNADPKITINGYNDNSFVLNFLKRQSDAGKTIILSMRGVSNYLAANQAVDIDNGLPISVAFQEPEAFTSYYRLGWAMKEIVRKLGRGTTTDSSAFRVGETTFPGLNRAAINYLEVGNETNSEYHAQMSAPAYFALMKIVRDSINLVDATMKLCGQGTTSQDIEYWKTFWLYTQWFNGKNKLLDLIDYHFYTSRVDDVYINPMGTTNYHKGATADWDSVNYSTANYVRQIKALYGPSIKVFCGEFGYEEGDTTIYANNSYWTNFSTPVITGKTLGQSRAAHMLWRIVTDGASGLVNSTTYTTVNPNYADMVYYTTIPRVQNPAQFYQMGMGWGGNTHLTNKTETYYVNEFIQKYFKGYEWDSTLITGRDTANVYRFRSRTSPDSAVFAARWGSDSLNTSHAYNIITKGMAGIPVKKVQTFGLTSNATSSTPSTSGNYITDNLTAMPAFYFIKESAPPPVNGAKVYRARIRIIVN